MKLVKDYVNCLKTIELISFYKSSKILKLNKLK